MPEDYDHAKAEATHLIYESDVDSVSVWVWVWVWVWVCSLKSSVVDVCVCVCVFCRIRDCPRKRYYNIKMCLLAVRQLTLVTISSNMMNFNHLICLVYTLF